MIQEERMTSHLMDIIRIDSPSRKEKDVARRLEEEMKDLGADCFYDDVGDKVEGNTGNLIVKLPGTKKDVPPLFSLLSYGHRKSRRGNKTKRGKRRNEKRRHDDTRKRR